MTYIATAMAPSWDEVIVWERNQTTGRRDLIRHPAVFYFFVPDEDGEYEDIYDNKLEKLEFKDSKQMRDAVDRFKLRGERIYESDISAEYKVLSKHYFGKEVGKLNVTFFDIEVDFDKTKGFAGPENPYAPINAISIYHQYEDKMVVYAIPPPGQEWDEANLPAELTDAAEVVFCKSEKQLLRCILAEFEDSDIISGWNSEGYDVPYVYERLKRVLGESAANKLSFDMARKPRYKEFEDRYGNTRQKLEIFGRVHIDFLQLLMKFEPGERDSWTLESVSEEELPHLPKLHYTGSLADLYRNDFLHFLRYNVRDSEVLKGLEDLKGYMTLAILLSHMDAARIEDVLGTIKLTETAIVNYCHYTLNKRVPDTNRDIDPNGGKFGGAFVLPPIWGLHMWLASIDVTSLYPSAMRTVNISPDTLVGQFTNYSDDYEKLRLRTGEMITARMEDNSEIELTTDEWCEFLQANKMSVSGFGTLFTQERQGFIPALLTMWFAQRKEYKAKAAEAKATAKKLKEAGDPTWREWDDKYKYYDKVQSIFKLKLNSTYGACGNKHFKFYDLRLAESTTKTGREVLMHMARTIGNELADGYHWPNEAVVYGDTDSCYFKTFGNDVEEALRIANYIANKINKSFPQFCRDNFFCTEGYDDLVKVAQEVVASKSIFINGKKGYMMRVLKDEGKDVDKIKVTGLQIKKTTMPKEIRNFLTDAFADFLRDKPWDEVGLSILEFKEQLRDAEWMRIGLPQRVKALDDYVARLNSGEEGVRVTGPARACMLYNQCLDEYGDKSSLRIVGGMKVMLFYLKKPIGKYKAIALPVDIEEIPEWFTEHFTRLIDRDLQVTKLVDKKLKSMLEAINERIPTRKGLMIDELFS
jgi:DNA polymerase elongation subunit (family B)